jgi:hypothetical protein
VSANSGTGGAGSVTSAEVAALDTVRSRVVTNIQVISATTMTDISGLSVSVSAGGTYQLMAQVNYTVSTAAAPVRFGLTFPAMVAGAGDIQGYISLFQGGDGYSTSRSHQAPFSMSTASGSIVYSAPGGTSAIVFPMFYRASFTASVGGVLQLQGFGSSTTGAIHIQRGSFVRLFQLA